MQFVVSASTDLGAKKHVNEDSLFVRSIRAGRERMVFAVLCDGMGGLSRGEMASASLIHAFSEWMNSSLPRLVCKQPEESAIQTQWNALVTRMNERIKEYGRRRNVSLGTTAIALLVMQRRYIAMNVGDSRLYEIADDIRQITSDQTVLAREVALGSISPQEALSDPRRHVLLQCVGASDVVAPDFYSGETKPDTVYLLCSDGFRNEITPGEIHSALGPARATGQAQMREAALKLIALNKKRNEKDNISVITIRTYPSEGAPC